MNLNSISLFHFTNKMDNIVHILKDGYFWPIYCPEVDKTKNGDKYAYAFPMVCFCDIPLSQINEQTDDYGSYAIAMSKEWATEKGISPVLYYSSTESLAIKLFKRNMNKISKKDKILWFALLKKCRGKTWSWKANKYKNKILYNEREWRYVPQTMTQEELCMKVVYEDFCGKEVSANTKKYGLTFDVKDIQYIIINKEDERKIFLDKLKNIILKDKDIICSKILSFEQIKNDF